MSATIDATYQAVVSGLPAELREPARRLLLELGYADDMGKGWADVFQLEPSTDLPRFAIPSHHSLEEGRLNAFRRAHHMACFYGVLVDRMADQQAAHTPERQRLAEHFLVLWQRSLAEAEGGEQHARWTVDRSARAWRCGVGLERAALARRSLGLRRYAWSIILKLDWAGVASESLLRHLGELHRLQLFRRAFCLLALGLQCVDDAADSAEDEARNGLSLPAVLGFAPNALFTAGTLLTGAAAVAAAQGGFKGFTQWLVQRTHELEQLRRGRVRPEDNLAGLFISSTLEAVCLSQAGRTLGRTAGTTCSASSR